MSENGIRLGIAGLGTVGRGLVKIVQQNHALLERRAGVPISISAVSARSRRKDRGIDISAYEWEDDAVELAMRKDIDVFVELIGGEDGLAKASVKEALKAGKHVVTANKALLAHHGQELAELAESQGVQLRFEAAVAGGIPIIKALTESLAANQITRVMGVMNGTTNYMLTRMEEEGIEYKDVFDDAKRLGYLEADPSLDVGGIDAAHKLSLLASIAYGSRINFDEMHIQGIEDITLKNITQAIDLGYKIRLLGVAVLAENGLELRLEPCLVPINSPFGRLRGVNNMILVEGDAIRQVVFEGPGAGEGPTASAVMADIMDIARGLNISVFGQAAHSLRDLPLITESKASPYYICTNLDDRPGALAEVAAILGKHEISIERMRQSRHDGNVAPVFILTHPSQFDKIKAAIEEITDLNVCLKDPMALRIETI